MDRAISEADRSPEFGVGLRSVAANSLFEAAVRGLAAFGKAELRSGVAVGPATRLTVAVKNPSVSHTIAVDRVRIVARERRSKSA
jgi:hypothetical protein